MEGVYTVSAEVKEKALEYRKSLYDENLGVETFIKARRIILVLLVVILFVHEAINAVFMLPRVNPTDHIVDTLIKLFSHSVLLLLPFLGKWKISICLYLVAIPSIIGVYIAMNYIETIERIWTAGPLLFLLFMLEVVYTILVTITALSLTLIPKCRRYSTLAREIWIEYTRFIRDNVFAGRSSSEEEFEEEE